MCAASASWSTIFASTSIAARIYTNNLYAFNTNITGELGITGVSQNPFTWGLPNLSFTHFGGITDTNPVNDRNQTWTFSDNMIWSHGKHTVRWGGDFRRIQLNTQTDSNPRGSFVFTGALTSQFVNGTAVPGTGYDFADFLLGLAQQTSVQYGYDRYYFRGNSWDLYVQDEWRARGNLTFNIGLRYEYVSPFSESNNRIVNLDTNSTLHRSCPSAARASGAGIGHGVSHYLVQSGPQQLRAPRRRGVEGREEYRRARRIRDQLQHRRVSEHRAEHGVPAAVL